MSLPLLLARRINLARVILQNSSSRSISSTSALNAGYWNKDWRPTDDPPTTEEGKRAAAKKYGMIPEDYEAYANDGTGYGDYPKLPIVSAESRNPHALYDFPELKRNFGEPLHVDADLFGEDRWDYNRRLIIPIHHMLFMFLGCIGFIFFMFWTGEYLRIFPNRHMPKHMAYNGKTYYTYEMEDVE